MQSQLLEYLRLIEMYDINATRLPYFIVEPSSGDQLNDMTAFDIVYVLSTELLDMLTDDFVRLA